MRSLKEIDVKDKTVLVRVDYNVPLDDNGEILNDFRLKASIPTIHYLIDHGASRIVLISHLGRPNGERDTKLSTEILVQKLANLVGRPIRFISECVGEDVTAGINTLPEKGIALLENLRFYPGEEQNDMDFARRIVETTGATIFVQDAFAVLHREAASTICLPKILKPCVGLLVERELTELSEIYNGNLEKPFVLVVGGSKVEDKAPIINLLKDKVDRVLVGGKIAADNYETDAENVYVAEDFEEQDGEKLDIGPKSLERFILELGSARTVVWNGNLGKTEDPRFEKASREVAEFLGNSSAKTMILGGDTTGYVLNLTENNKALRYDFISTGGSASLRFLTDGTLPGLEVI